MKKLCKKLIVLAAAAALTNIWCSGRFRLEDWQVASARLPQSFDGFRISLLTDIHGAVFGKDSAALAQAVKRSKPDLIAISGDLADRWTDLRVLKPMVQALTELAPVYYVTGNHEWSREDTEQLLSKLDSWGVTVLRNSWQEVSVGGQRIVVAGAEDPNAYADGLTPRELMEQLREQMPDDPYVVMLYHRNDSLSMWAPLEPDLVLAGHGHGGVVRLPVVGGLIGVDRSLLPDNCEGLYTQGRTTLAVSCGLAGVRVWNSPHIPTIVLRWQAESVNKS